MKKIILLFYLFLLGIYAIANDGIFYTSGNQLIPITETEISVQKEILSITRQGDQLYVHVYYEFFNPGAEKTLLVGFEAMPPGGAWAIEEEEYKKLTDHPNIFDFTVKLNGQSLKYQVSHVENQENYFQNGKFDELSKQRELELGREWEFSEGIPYYFVYHFDATFKKGLNIVEHTYLFDASDYVGTEYCFEYVLTAANRWANHQIDDFTLNLDLGPRCTYDVNESFFKGQGGWTIDGVGRQNEIEKYDIKMLRFHIQDGMVTYHQKNFHPEGELFVERPFVWDEEGYFNTYEEEGDCFRAIAFEFKKGYTSAMKIFYMEDEDTAECSEISDDMKKIMRNLPFAYRGYVFKTKMLQDYFESTDWYVANPDYVSDMKDLSEEERRWVDFWTKQQKK